MLAQISTQNPSAWSQKLEMQRNFTLKLLDEEGRVVITRQQLETKKQQLSSTKEG